MVDRLEHHVPVDDGRNVFLDDVREKELEEYRNRREAAAKKVAEAKAAEEAKKSDTAKKAVPAKKATSK